MAIESKCTFCENLRFASAPSTWAALRTRDLLQRAATCDGTGRLWFVVAPAANERLRPLVKAQPKSKRTTLIVDLCRPEWSTQEILELCQFAPSGVYFTTSGPIDDARVVELTAHAPGPCFTDLPSSLVSPFAAQMDGFHSATCPRRLPRPG